mmetsp:Transcript_38256/g.123045  ORF Transcript_38256/g.123045 Transcript_38256/m.123045 type:complete len:205 (+) Transcript_38256:1012-1626(+)
MCKGPPTFSSNSSFLFSWSRTRPVPRFSSSALACFLFSSASAQASARLFFLLLANSFFFSAFSWTKTWASCVAGGCTDGELRTQNIVLLTTVSISLTQCSAFSTLSSLSISCLILVALRNSSAMSPFHRSVDSKMALNISSPTACTILSLSTRSCIKCALLFTFGKKLRNSSKSMSASQSRSALPMNSPMCAGAREGSYFFRAL